MRIHLGLAPAVFDRLPGVPVKWRRGASTGQNSINGLAAVVAAASGGGGGLRDSAARTAMVRAQLARIVSRSPQVMVKVTGRQHGAAHALANFQYIAGKEGREGRDEGIETDRGEIVKDPVRMKEIADRWDRNNLAVGERRVGATSISMVFSMPPGTNADKLKDSVREFAAGEFGGHEWVMARHTDAPHPHVHLTVARVGREMERLDPRIDDLKHYRERFAELLRERGIEVDASSRFDRGFANKGERTPFYRMKERAKAARDPSMIPRKSKEARTEAEKRVASVGLNDSPSLRDRDRVVIGAQQLKREAYALAAEALGQSDDAGDRQLGAQLKTYVGEMPQPMTTDMKRLFNVHRVRIAEADEQRERSSAPALLKPDRPRTDPEQPKEAEPGVRSTADRLQALQERLGGNRSEAGPPPRQAPHDRLAPLHDRIRQIEQDRDRGKDRGPGR
jgi:hypothetical protein